MLAFSRPPLPKHVLCIISYNTIIVENNYQIDQIEIPFFIELTKWLANIKTQFYKQINDFEELKLLTVNVMDIDYCK